jgi:hypothetical protein
MDHETDELFMARLFPLDGEAGPATRIGAQHADDLVDGALDAFFAEQAAEVRPIERRRPSPMRWLVAAATLLAVTGSASAAILIQRRIREASVTVPETRAPRARREPAPYPPPGAGIEIEAAPPPAVVDPVEEVVEETAPAVRHTPARPPREVARDLLAEANRLRGQRSFREADRTYGLVVRAEPSSREAYVARIASASLKLEHLGDPSGAVRLYQQALRAGSNGALAAEAQYGLARGYRRLGQTEAERRTLAIVVARYPSSPYASAAQRRLAELSAASPSQR